MTLSKLEYTTAEAAHFSAATSPNEKGIVTMDLDETAKALLDRVLPGVRDAVKEEYGHIQGGKVPGSAVSEFLRPGPLRATSKSPTLFNVNRGPLGEDDYKFGRLLQAFIRNDWSIAPLETAIARKFAQVGSQPSTPGRSIIVPFGDLWRTPGQEDAVDALQDEVKQALPFTPRARAVPSAQPGRAAGRGSHDSPAAAGCRLHAEGYGRPDADVVGREHAHSDQQRHDRQRLADGEASRRARGVSSGPRAI